MKKEKKVLHKTIKIMVILAVALLQFTVQAQEVRKTGTTAAKFLSIGVSPRALGMGSAFSSLADDASAMYWNPAGLASLTENQAIFTYTDMFVDIKHQFFGIAMPMGEMGTLGFHLTMVNYGEMEVTTVDYPEGIGLTFSAGSYAIGFSYARQITEDFSIGANVKYLIENISNSSASGIAFDVGTIFDTPFYGIRFASSINNFGSKMQMEGDDLLMQVDTDESRNGNNDQIDAYLGTDEYDIPLKLQIGLSRDFMIDDMNRITLAIDATHPNDNAQYVNAGAEIGLLNDMFMIRGGYSQLFLDDAEEGLTLGAGFNYKVYGSYAIAVDYAYQSYEHLTDKHSFGLLIKF